jgi:hypothetical protein
VKGFGENVSLLKMSSAALFASVAFENTVRSRALETRQGEISTGGEDFAAGLDAYSHQGIEFP